MQKKFSSPFWLPVYAFGLTILAGSSALMLDVCHPGKDLSFINALFTATSAVCVTGLAVVDTGSFYSRAGQDVILALIQLGGLGIMTYASLVMYLLRHKVSTSDRLSVSQTLLHDPSFNLANFIVGVIIAVFSIEIVGAVLLNRLDPVGFNFYSAFFHSVSAFCNAGFSLYPDSLTRWQGNLGVNIVFAVLIIMGGLGFYVLAECARKIRMLVLKKKRPVQAHFFTWHTKIVLETTFYLIFFGTLVLLFAEKVGDENWNDFLQMGLSSFFQSVTCRTAGFNTVDISSMTNVSLIFMISLMVIGGSPGSCAGGLKTTTLRVWIGFIVARLRGRSQTRVGWYAMTEDSINKALTLLVFGVLIMGGSVILLSITEGHGLPHPQARGHFIELLFETVSAFATVGLSTGVTPTLSGAGKIIIILLMFVGRLGPVWLLSAINSWQSEPRFRLPQDDLPLG
jgi:trk system potassium uptake protein TrkH